MSQPYQSLSPSRWDCKYHVVFVPKRRRTALFGNIRQHLGAIFHELARQKECRIIEGHLDGGSRPQVHRHPAQGRGLVGHRLASCGKSAIAIARQFGGRERNFAGEHCWARGYAVSTVGFELEEIRRDIREQEGGDEQGLF